MNSSFKTVGITVITTVLVLLGISLVGGNQPEVSLGGLTNFDEMGTTEGYEVDNSQVIDGDGNWVGGTITGSTADFSGTTTVGRFEQSGGITTLTDANGGAFTLTQAQMNSGVMSFAAGGAGQAAITITLPATSTLTTIIPNAGDRASWIYDSSFLATATTTTFAAGTGIAIHEPSGGNLVVAGQTQATLTCWRKANTDIACEVIEAQPG